LKARSRFGALRKVSKYGEDDTYGTARVAGSIDDRSGRLAWRLSYSHLDTHSQPLSYVTAASITAAGAYDDTNRAGLAIKVLGSTGLEHQVQDNLSGRMTFDLPPTVTAAYKFGLFKNKDEATVNSYLRDGSGNAVYTTAFSTGVYILDEEQLAQGLSLTSHTGGDFDFSLTASGFQYLKSHQRTPGTLLPGAFAGALARGRGSTAQAGRRLTPRALGGRVRRMSLFSARISTASG